MLSLVIPEVSTDGTRFIDGPTTVWDDDKEKDLEALVEEYTKDSDPSNYFSSIDWQAVSDQLAVKDVDFIKCKVDELYDKKFDVLFTRQEVDTTSLIDQWVLRRGVLFREVETLIKRAGLQDFLVDDDEPPQESAQGPSHINGTGDRHQELSPSLKVPGVGEALRRPPTNRQAAVSLAHATSGGNSHKRTEIPHLTMTQRRMSLNLMHMDPESLESSVDNKARSVSFSRPASVGTSNVNVITKAEAQATVSRQEIRTSPTRGIFRDMLKKFKLNLVRGNHPRPEMPMPQIVVSPRKQESMASLKKEANKPARVPLNMEKRRRTSLVGENLPSYIRDQLKRDTVEKDRTISNGQEHPEQANGRVSPDNAGAPAAHTSPTTRSPRTPVSARSPLSSRDWRRQDSRDPRENSGVRSGKPSLGPSLGPSLPPPESTASSRRTAGRTNRSRLHNLLMNSQSLYAYKDVGSGKASENSNGPSANNSTYDTERDDKIDSETDDKEYMLPSLFAKYYGVGADEETEQMLRELDEEDADFLNINDSYDDIIEGNAINTENNDDYLFAN